MPSSYDHQPDASAGRQNAVQAMRLRPAGNPLPGSHVEQFELWNIYGKLYDLTTFLDSHPGGRRILELARQSGGRDLTSSFESYHALANLPSIRKQLQRYAAESESCPPRPPLYTFDNSGFYSEVRRRVRKVFADGDAEGDNDRSLTHKVKIDQMWVTVTFLQLLMFSLLFITAFFGPFAKSVRIFSAFGAGLVYIGRPEVSKSDLVACEQRA